MDLDLGPEIARFRAELREWITAEAPAELPGLIDWYMPMTAGGRRGGVRFQVAARRPYTNSWLSGMGSSSALRLCASAHSSTP